MAIDLRMPALSPTMEKGTLAKWLVAEGDRVSSGDCLEEIETDKATMELEAVDSGRIVRLVAAEGTDDVAVGTVIALLAEDGDGVPEQVGDHEMLTAADSEDRASSPEIRSDSVRATSIEVSSKPFSQSRGSPADRITVSPLAQRIADAKGIDLAIIVGTGPNGRVVRADLGLGSIAAPSAMLSGRSLDAAAANALWTPPDGVPVSTIKLSQMRRAIARRLAESKQSVPHFYLTARCTLDSMLKLRQELNDSLTARGIRVSVNDLLIKAMAIALIEAPDANVQFGGEVLHRFSRADISMAVAVDGGLVTPVVRNACSLSVSAIAQQTKSLAEKARAGKLAADEYHGGTASISNLGMFGIDAIGPVINPPQALILGIGAGIEQPWKVDGQIMLATLMSATASFDHRAIDGAAAAAFMATFRDLVEHPLKLIG